MTGGEFTLQNPNVNVSSGDSSCMDIFNPQPLVADSNIDIIDAITEDFVLVSKTIVGWFWYC